jgi:hypothetical protein
MNAFDDLDFPVLTAGAGDDIPGAFGASAAGAGTTPIAANLGALVAACIVAADAVLVAADALRLSAPRDDAPWLGRTLS